uniref:Uncharacterized protein n=1 Tax=Candidatus Kentrum sp. LPFa TaxID=2126335 RepID=A0A450XBV1_9GAMM|nr:MAG: hypothetical protein BECKLPF1236A_GA0070988_1004121 [Candidatus Kentron sp. LPFa]VFK26760.1 MAG: hypothetical protein BECKLPF1236C_GA0070990_1003823 [Candidatus Kentron sp. LPFa]
MLARSNRIQTGCSLRRRRFFRNFFQNLENRDFQDIAGWILRQNGNMAPFYAALIFIYSPLGFTNEQVLARLCLGPTMHDPALVKRRENLIHL